MDSRPLPNCREDKEDNLAIRVLPKNMEVK